MGPALKHKLSVEQAAYLAGAIDGEGCVTSCGLSSLRVAIANTNRQWLEQLQSWVGGIIQEHRGRFNKRPSYSLSLLVEESGEALAQCQPYLILKKKQAELYFRLAGLRRQYAGGTRRGYRTDPEYAAARDEVFAELRLLNKRGVVGQPYPGPPKSLRQCAMDGCGRAHYSNGYCKQHYKKYIERGGPAWHERDCKQCGKPFVAKRSDAEFCSKTCADHAFYGANKDELLMRLRQQRAAQRQPRACPQCQAVFTPRRTDAVFCSRRCGQEFRRKRLA